MRRHTKAHNELMTAHYTRKNQTKLSRSILFQKIYTIRRGKIKGSKERNQEKVKIVNFIKIIRMRMKIVDLSGWYWILWWSEYYQNRRFKYKMKKKWVNKSPILKRYRRIRNFRDKKFRVKILRSTIIWCTNLRKKILSTKTL